MDMDPGKRATCIQEMIRDVIHSALEDAKTQGEWYISIADVIMGLEAYKNELIRDHLDTNVYINEDDDDENNAIG